MYMNNNQFTQKTLEALQLHSSWPLSTSIMP